MRITVPLQFIHDGTQPNEDTMTKKQAYHSGFVSAVEKGVAGFSVYHFEQCGKAEYDYFLHKCVDRLLGDETYTIGINEQGNPCTKQI